MTFKFFIIINRKQFDKFYKAIYFIMIRSISTFNLFLMGTLKFTL